MAFLQTHQTIVAALIGLLGASTAVLAVIINHYLIRIRTRRIEREQKLNKAIFVISVLEAESTFSEKERALVNHYLFTGTSEQTILKIDTDLIKNWLNTESSTAEVSMSEVQDFWREIYAALDGFPSPISEIVAYASWAAGRSILLIRSHAKKSKEAQIKSENETIQNIRVLLYIVADAGAYLLEELTKYRKRPERYLGRSRNILGSLVYGAEAKALAEPIKR